MSIVIKKERLSEQVVRMRIQAPRIAKKRKAGQFIILRPTENGERVPLTIANADSSEGWIEIIFQVVGKTTAILAELAVDDSLADLVGPLGKPTHIQNFGRCICIGGGIGVAPLYPIVCALREQGNWVTTVLCARNSKLLILEDEMRAASSELIVATDDGSKGIKGFGVNVFESLTKKGEHFDFAAVIGPVLMMKFTSKATVAAGIPTVSSLNPIMIDGTGMCGGCRVTVGGKTKFACVDGPEFDAALIDFDGLVKRLGSYTLFEKPSMEAHRCKLEGAR